MKSSQFNIFLPSSTSDKQILINTLSRTLCEIPDAVAETIRSEGSLPPDLEQALREIAVITDSPETQREAAFASFREEQSNVRDLNVVIPLTSKCNLKCSYCYQVLHGDFQGDSAAEIADWTSDAINSLVGFVQREMADGNYEGVRIRWYGGEPLLRLDLIQRIGDLIKQKVVAAQRRLSGMVVTNGVLISDKAINVLSNFNVDRLEISVDGPRDTHDLLRASKNGRSTYNQIIESIVRAADYFETIVFRVNVHTQNAPKINGWLYEVAPLITKPNIFLKFKLVEGDKSNQLDYENFSALTLEYSLTAKALGLNLLQKRLATETCPAIRKNYFIVQADLKVYKCPQNLGSNDSVGAITPDGSFEPNWRLNHWTGYDVARESDCSSCAHLPHCNGGCPYNQIMYQINSKALKVYSRKERCCREKLVPELLLPRLQ